jgi:CRISPR-associated protein Csc3
MFFLQFLRDKDKVQFDDPVIHLFVEHMLPRLMTQYADISAKGGDHSKYTERRSEEARGKFEAKDDQSMVSHLLNGIFPTLGLLKILEDEEMGMQPYTDIERQVYVLSYLMHDVDKIMYQDEKLDEDERKIDTSTREAIEETIAKIRGYLEQCGAGDFFPGYTDYLEDITYLVVNTQRKYGTHLHTYLWRFHLQERRVLELRDLCFYSDKIAYLVRYPAAILLEPETKALTTILAGLSEDKLVFSYHQLREVRGLLTSVINSGLDSLFTDDKKREGIWPYLFFSDGVVYIQRKLLKLAITTEQIVEKAREQLRTHCAGVIKSQAPGFKFSIQGIVKHPGYYYEFLSLEEYFELLADFTIKRTTNDITVIPIGKLRQMQERGEIAANIPLDFHTDRQTGMLSRFYSVLFTTLLGGFDKKQATLRERVEEAVIKQLGLSPYWEQGKEIPNKGGVEYRWFWLAACYQRDHQGLDLYGETQSLEALFKATMQLIIELAGDELRRQMPQQYLNHLTQYLDSVVELPLTTRDGGTLPDFRAELERYSKAKSKGRKLLCTLCNSAYPTEEQSDNAVLFQPWVYKNKLSLYAGKNAGGVCAICALELMLRQILLKGQLRLTGSKFEALKTKYLAVYPNFFFTRETGAIVQGILDQLNDINFFTIRRQLEGRDIGIEDLLKLDVFAAPAQKQMVPQAFVHKEEEEESDDGEVKEEGEVEGASTMAERSYIKFLQPGDFPGLLLFGMRAGKDDTDSATWAMPAFLALALPLVTSTKVVISEMSLPLFSSGGDFRETVVFDAPHPFLDRLLKGKRVRVNQLLPKLRLLSSVYRVNIDTYAKQGKPEWKHLSAIARDIETDPLYLFSYLRRQERIDSKYRSDIALYLRLYKLLEGNLEGKLSKIEHCVDLYAAFYRGGYQSHSILKPVDIVARAIITSPINIEEEDLLWQIRGELKSWLDRVRNRQSTGYAVFRGKDIDLEEAPKVKEFVKIFYQEVFIDYCQGERGVLRSRINRFKDGCEAYYVDQYKQQRFKEQDEEAELTVTQ